MTCAACATSVESMISAQPAVDKAEVNYASQSVNVAYHNNQIKPAGVAESGSTIGYDFVIGRRWQEIQEETILSDQFISHDFVIFPNTNCLTIT